MRTSFMDWFGLSAPIVQAPIGGAATVGLATAVGRAGGLGSLPMTWAEKQAGLNLVAELAASGVPFFLNFALRFGSERPLWYCGGRAPAVTFSWGLDADLIAAFRAARQRVGVQVGSLAGAKTAIAAGADFIIVQGIEAGGHVQSSTPLVALLKEVVTIAGDVPVIAAGGIARGNDIAAMLRLGAQAVMLGTRFVASDESLAHPAYKQALVEARASDQAYSNCFDIDWPYAMHGVLRNSTLEAWEAAGCPASPNRPGEGDVIFRRKGEPLVRYCDTPPYEGAEGDVLAGCLYAGAGVGGITSVMPAREIVERLWAEALAVLAK
ncbi:MAG: nitronate monooxygenase [Alphaproteobacteria bacterium]|nr:nitronate monooxygenase [Alphaproteobacteria bacterium]